MAKVIQIPWKPEGPRIVPLKDHPELRNDPRAMTILVGLNARGNGPAIYSKKYENGKEVKKTFNPTYHLAYVAPASGIVDIASALTEMAKYPAAIVVPGAVRAAALHQEKVNRRRKSDPRGEPDLEAKLHHILAVDLDSVPAPKGYNWREDPARTAKFAIVSYLPIPFHNAAFYVELSASAGMKDSARMNLHLWFWLAQPLGDDQLKKYFEDHNQDFNKVNEGLAPLEKSGKPKGAKEWPVDVSLFQPQQPAYSGYPYLINTPDPVPNRARLVMDGCQPEVILPMTCIAAQPAPAAAPPAVLPTRDPLVEALLWEEALKRNDPKIMCEYNGINLSIEELRAMLPYAVANYNKDPKKGRALW